MFDSSSGDPIPKPKSSKRMPSGARGNISTCSRRAIPPFASGGIAPSLDSVSIKRAGLSIPARSRRPLSLAGSISILTPWLLLAIAGEGQNHDVYIELAGPSAVDIHHNFVQRWNEASERHSADGRWGSGSELDLPLPTRLPC